jgi:hypothetical protein
MSVLVVATVTVADETETDALEADALETDVPEGDAPVAPVAPAEHAVGSGTDACPRKGLKPRQFAYSVAQKAWLASGSSVHAL